MQIRDGRPDDKDAVLALSLARCPHTEPWLVEAVFTDGGHVDVLTVATEDERVVGWGYAMHIPGVPEHQRSCYVLVGDEAAGRGTGRELYARVRAGVPASVTDLRTRVFRGDEVALAVAEHWGFESVQVSITSRLVLDDVAPAVSPDGVSLEVADDLRFADAEAVEAMFAASQTNPEATNSHLMTIPGVRRYVFPGEHGIATVARVDGVPAALCFAIVAEDGDDGGVAYTGVDPRFRGRGLGRLVKQDVHHRAYQYGIRRLGTDNEEHNEGIRRLNAEMGFVEEYGVHRMRRLVTPGELARG